MTGSDRRVTPKPRPLPFSSVDQSESPGPSKARKGGRRVWDSFGCVACRARNSEHGRGWGNECCKLARPRYIIERRNRTPSCSPQATTVDRLAALGPSHKLVSSILPFFCLPFYCSSRSCASFTSSVCVAWLFASAIGRPRIDHHNRITLHRPFFCHRGTVCLLQSVASLLLRDRGNIARPNDPSVSSSVAFSRFSARNLRSAHDRIRHDARHLDQIAAKDIRAASPDTFSRIDRFNARVEEDHGYPTDRISRYHRSLIQIAFRGVAQRRNRSTGTTH